MSETEGQGPEPPRDSLAKAAAETLVRPKPPPRAHPRLFGSFVAIGIGALLIGAAGLGFSQLHLLNDPREEARATELATLRSELQATNSRLQTMEQAAAAKPDAALGDVAARLESMDTRLGALESQVARTADRDTLTAVQDRLTRLEKDTAGVMLRRAATILALANLARAAESGGGFEQELSAVRTLAPDDPALSPLEPLATGVPSVAELAGSFPEAARAAIQTETDQNAGRNPIARLWANVRRLVSVRRIGDVEGNTNNDRLARAQADLDRRDLAAAVIEVSAISSPASRAIAPWVTRAQARLAAERAIADMNRRVAQDLVLP
jgi:hypothetical protein